MSILGTALPAANTLVTLYEVPTGRRSVVNVAACNQGAVSAKVRLALTASLSATPAQSEFIEYDLSLGSTEVLERTALSLAAGQRVMVQASGPAVSFNAWGIEEVA